MEKEIYKKINIIDVDKIKNYFKEISFFFLDVSFLIGIYIFINFIGFDSLLNIESFIDIESLIAKNERNLNGFNVLIFLGIFLFIRIFLQGLVCENTSQTINKFIACIFIGLFLYMSSSYATVFLKQNTTFMQIPNIVEPIIFIVINFIFLGFSCIISILLSIEKKGMDFNFINKFINIIVIVSFLNFISNSEFNNFKNYIFNSNIENEFSIDFKEVFFYLNLVLFCFIVFPGYKMESIFNHGRRINSIIILSTFIIILIEIIKNYNNIINYDFISYMLIIMMSSILLISFLINYKSNNKEIVISLLFNSLFVFYVLFKPLYNASGIYMIIEMFLITIISVFGFKRIIFNAIDKILIISIIGIVFVLCIYQAFNFELESKHMSLFYISLFLLAGLLSCYKNKQTIYYNGFKNILDFIRVLYDFKFFKENVMKKKEIIKHERLKKNYLYNTNYLGIIIYITNHRFIIINLFKSKYITYNYNELTIDYKEDEFYITYKGEKLYNIKKENIRIYLNKKIKESLSKKNNKTKSS